MPTIFDQFAVLKPDMRVDQRTVTADFYQQLDVDYDNFHAHALVSAHQFSEDWPTWEVHPAGDEMVVLISGKVKLLMRVNGEDESVTLQTPGEYIVVPRGTWHTAKVAEPTNMLFITPGEGTLNEPTPPLNGD